MKDEYKRDFRAAFNFLAKWEPHPATLADWESAARESGEVYAQNGGSKLLCALMVAVFDELDRQYQIDQEGKEEKCG